MDRRGFLGSLIAVTTAVASGVRLPSGREIAKATPKAIAVQNQLMKMLEECVVTSINARACIDGPMTYEVDYLHSPGCKKNDTTLMIDGYTSGMRPVNVSFSASPDGYTRLTVEWV